MKSFLPVHLKRRVYKPFRPQWEQLSCTSLDVMQPCCFLRPSATAGAAASFSCQWPGKALSATTPWPFLCLDGICLVRVSRKMKLFFHIIWSSICKQMSTNKKKGCRSLQKWSWLLRKWTQLLYKIPQPLLRWLWSLTNWCQPWKKDFGHYKSDLGSWRCDNNLFKNYLSHDKGDLGH